MKKILATLMLAILIVPSVSTQNKKVLFQDSLGKGKVTITKTEPNKEAKTTESVYIPAFTDTDESGTVIDSAGSSYTASIALSDSDEYQGPLFQGFMSELGNEFGGGKTALSIVAIVFAFFFGFPLLIILITLYFRYKSKRDRYRLVEKALAAGQPIPEGLFKESLNLDTKNKGIKNIFTGIGLFIFLWAITGEFGIGTIGLLIMFTGIGQWIIARNQSSSEEPK